MSLESRLIFAPLCAILFAAALPARAADAWAQEGGDAGATSSSPQTVLNAGNLGGLKELWARDLDIWAQSTPIAVSGDEVYVGRKIEDPETTIQPQLVRLDRATGKTVWKVRSPDSFAMPLLTPGLVVVAGNGTGTGAKSTSLRAYDRATGEARWHYRIAGQGNRLSSPHLRDGVIFFASTFGHAAGVDAETGVPRWERKLDVGCCGVNGVAVGAGVVLVGSYEGLQALDAADGHDRWSYTLPQSDLATERPVIVGSRALLFDHRGQLHAFDAATGAELWTVATPVGDMQGSMAHIATDGERAYLLNGVVRPALSAIDLQSGSTLWSLRPGAWSHSLLVSNGVLFLSTARHVLAFDSATGATLPIAALQAMRWGELSLADGHLLISGGPVRAFALTSP